MLGAAAGVLALLGSDILALGDSQGLALGDSQGLALGDSQGLDFPVTGVLIIDWHASHRVLCKCN